MYKSMLFFIILFSVVLLSGCFESPESIDDAKKEMGILEEASTSFVDEGTNAPTGDTGALNTEELTPAIELATMTITEKDDTKLIALQSPSSADVNPYEIEIHGTTLGHVESIVVDFSNPTSEYPDDHYPLQAFSAGDSDFVYRAFSKYKVLDYGVNTYMFTAKNGDTESQIEVVITIPKNTPVHTGLTEATVQYEKQLFGTEDATMYLSFPKSDTFGEMVKLGENSFTYSRINGLEVIQDTSRMDYRCDTLTTRLQEDVQGWFYWNTCRDIIKDRGISFYVLRLEGDNYTYEKHYVDWIHNLYGVYEITTGTGVDSGTIAEKNSEFKELYAEDATISIVDTLFEEIVR